MALRCCSCARLLLQLQQTFLQRTLPSGVLWSSPAADRQSLHSQALHQVHVAAECAWPAALPCMFVVSCPCDMLHDNVTNTPSGAGTRGAQVSLGSGVRAEVAQEGGAHSKFEFHLSSHLIFKFGVCPSLLLSLLSLSIRLTQPTWC